MLKKSSKSIVFAIVFTAITCWAQQPQTPRASTGRQVHPSYGQLPLMFVANQGQTDSRVQFLSQGDGYSVSLTSGGMFLTLRPGQATSPQNAPGLSVVHGHRRTFSPVRQLEANARAQKSLATMLAIKLVGAAANPTTIGEEPLATKINYFIGRDPSKWRRNVPTYGRIRYRNVYPGIDLVYYGNNHRIEYDFDLAPGADATKIQFSVNGADAVSIDSSGNLILTAGGKQLLFQIPVIYQEINGVRAPVAGSYVQHDATHVGFVVGSHDNTKPLVIDPVLVYSSFLGDSSNDFSSGVAVDSSGDAYVIGLTDSPNFPLATIGSYTPTQFRMYLAEFDPTGSTLLFADYFGGTSGDDEAYAVALDSSGNPYVTGCASSADFPVVNAYQSNLAGSQDAFLVKFSADGSSLTYSTYLGGSNLNLVGGVTEQLGYSVSVDPSGEAIVAGVTMATDFPTVNAYQSSVSTDQFGDWGEYGFVTKFAADGGSLVYSTYLAGSTLNVSSCSGCFPDSEIYGVVSDNSGNAYLTGITGTTDFPVTSGAYATTFPGYAGTDVEVGFVSKFTSSGALSYSTFLGGLGSTYLDGIAVDSTGSAYVTGYDTADDNFPIVTTSICDPSSVACNGTVIAKLNPAGSSLVYSTFLGTSNNMYGQKIQVDAFGDAFILGSALAFDESNPIETYAGGGDVVVAEIDPAATTLLFATFLGGQNWEAATGLALDSNGAVYVAGMTQSIDFPVTQSAFQTSWGGQTDTFISKIDPTANSPAVAMGPFSLQFPSQGVGSASAAQTTILRNMGSAPLLIASKTITGDFAETDDCGTMVAAASLCTFNITFTPTANGTRTGTLAIANDAPGSPHSVALTGTGTGGPEGFGVSPTSLNFSSSPAGTATTPQTVTVTNNNNHAVAISPVQTTGDFAITGNHCGSIAANGTCTVQVSFTPTSAGASTGTLRLIDAATGNVQVVPLNGSGVDFVTSATTTTASVSAGSSATYQLNVGSVGGKFGNAVSFTCQGAPFAATCTVGPQSITPGSNSSKLTVTVKTSGPRAQVHEASAHGGRLLALLSAQFGIFGVVVLVAGNRRKSRFVIAMGATIMLLLLVGCGGTGAGVQQSPIGSNLTPAGTYQLSVVGTSGSLRHTATLTLTVR